VFDRDRDVDALVEKGSAIDKYAAKPVYKFDLRSAFEELSTNRLAGWS
jgi:hypothetical protein